MGLILRVCASFTFVPALDNLTDADLSFEGFIAIARRVEYCAIFELFGQ